MRDDFSLPFEERLIAGDLVALVAGYAPAAGPNASCWPGLTFYRFETPAAPQWSCVNSLALCIVVQGRKRVTIDGAPYVYDPLHYFVMKRGMRFQAEILDASHQKPYLSLVLQVEPGVINRVAADIRSRTTTLFTKLAPETPAYVSPIDANMIGAVTRFLRAISGETDRQVLAPMYLQEIVYRLLADEQCTRLIDASMQERSTNAVSASIHFLKTNLSRQVTVAELAEFVAMSPSTFAHLFKSVIGVSPYQFLKQLRLERALELLCESDNNVSETSAAVGYASLSHFINEFKRRYGVTPGHYVASQRERVQFSLGRVTSR
jgi:AraC-like DNA-binding protein